MALDAIPSSQNTKKPMVYAARRCSITASPWYMISNGSNKVVKTMSAMPATRKDGHRMWIRRCIMAYSSSGWTSFFGVVHLALVPVFLGVCLVVVVVVGFLVLEADRAAE